MVANQCSKAPRWRSCLAGLDALLIWAVMGAAGLELLRSVRFIRIPPKFKCKFEF